MILPGMPVVIDKVYVNDATPCGVNVPSNHQWTVNDTAPVAPTAGWDMILASLASLKFCTAHPTFALKNCSPAGTVKAKGSFPLPPPPWLPECDILRCVIPIWFLLSKMFYAKYERDLLCNQGE
jgi:hypothetical protein